MKVLTSPEAIRCATDITTDHGTRLVKKGVETTTTIVVGKVRGMPNGMTQEPRTTFQGRLCVGDADCPVTSWLDRGGGCESLKMRRGNRRVALFLLRHTGRRAANYYCRKKLLDKISKTKQMSMKAYSDWFQLITN